MHKPKGQGTSFTFIEIPLGPAEISADLSSYCEILSKFREARLDNKSLDCLFRNLTSSSLSEAKDFLFSSYKAVRGVKTNCETKLQIDLSPMRTSFRQMGIIFYQLDSYEKGRYKSVKIKRNIAANRLRSS